MIALAPLARLIEQEHLIPTLTEDFEESEGDVIEDITSVDEYMAALPDARRAVMEQVRGTVRSAAPDATEAIAYNMPAFRLGGRFLVSYEAFKRH